jgi:hypothetical protein
MRSTLHKLSFALLAVTISASAWIPSAGAKPLLPVKIDGEHSATVSILQKDRQFVPAVFFRSFGVTVTWIAESQSVSLRKDDFLIQLPSGGASVIHRQEGTYIPLRYAAEALGMAVGYEAPTGTVTVDTNPAMKPSASEQALSSASEQALYWLGQITEAEAGGESYEGKVAVAAVILNRMESPVWPNTIQDVIFQIVKVDGTSYYQFSPVLDGRIYEVEATEETVRAVQEAMQGKDPTGGATVFYNPAKTNNAWVKERPVTTTIGNHVFAS